MRAQILENEAEFTIVSAYDKKLVGLIHKIKGRRWHPANKTWTIPIGQRQKVEELYYEIEMDRMLSMPPQVGPIPPMPKLQEEIDLIRPPFPFQNDGIAYCLQHHEHVIIGDQPGLGKAQPLTSKIATPDGYIYMRDAKVGADVLGADGNTYKIEGVFPQGYRTTYVVEFNDGSTVRCDGDHLWQVRDVNRRRRGTGWIIKTTAELLAAGLKYVPNLAREASGRGQILKWEIPIAKPFDRPSRNHTISPYILGVLIGDGSLTTGRVMFSTPDIDSEIVERVKNRLPADLKVVVNRHPDCPQYAVTQTGTTRPNPFLKEIERLGLDVKSGGKFIPEEYLFAGHSERLELLRGLMDTDGSAKDNRITFHTCSEQLANDVVELVFSLGGQAILRPYDRSAENKPTEWQVNVRLADCPFYLARKAGQWHPKKSNYCSRYIYDIRKVGVEEEVQCIKVSAPDHLYLTDHFIVTHNTTQAIGAVVARNRFPCLVICPNTLKSNWKTEWMTVAGKKALVLDDKNRNTWHLFHHPHKLVDVFIVNYESLQKYFVSHIKKNEKGGFMVKDVVFNEHADIFQSIIVDESHKCKNMQVQWTKFTMGICLRKKAVYAVSGTPLVNSTKDLAAQLFITGRIHEFGGLKFFTKRYVDTNEYLAELQYKLRTTCFFQRKKKDVLKDLPDKVRQIMLCDITNWPEYKVALADLERYLREWKNKTDEQVRKSMRGEIMVQMTMCRNIAARGKMNEVFEYIDQISGAGEKVGIFLNQHQIKHILQAKYPHAVAVTGEEDIDQRAAAVHRFQNDPKCKLILLSIKAAGVGITLTAASRVGLVEFPWHPADGDQCEDRFHRIGQKDSVQATYFLGKGTIDERMYEIMEEKRALGGEVTGNRDDTMTEMIDKLADSLFTTKREAELTI